VKSAEIIRLLTSVDLDSITYNRLDVNSTFPGHMYTFDFIVLPYAL